MTTTLSQTGSEIQVDLNAVEAGNIGKTSITDLTDTTVAAAKKSGYHSLQASSSNAPSADRSVIVSAVRNTTASGELRYGQVLLSESNKLYWNTDDGGVLGTWREAVSTAGGQTLTNKSITGGSLAIDTISEESAAAGVTIDSVLLKDNTVLAGTLTAGAGSITDSSGAISFGDENLSTTGTLSVGGTLGVTGVLTGTSLDISGDIDVDGTTNLDVVDIDGAVDIATTALVTGVLTTTATQVATGGITSGSNIVSDTDSTDDLGTTSVRWANLFVDSITATDQITATGFTGTLDGILGSGAAAAATVTTLDTSGAVNLNLVTDSSSSTSGALIVDGGVGIAKKLYVGTDLDVDGTTNLDVVDIDGAVDMASTLQVDGISTFTGQITANGGMEFVDNKKLTFGTGDDLEIYHDGSNSYINDVGTGNLLIRGANVLLTTGGGTKYLEGGSNVLTLFHTGNERFRTSSAGVYVTGTVTATGTSVFESLDISGDIDVDGTTNLDIVDIDGAVDIATTALVTGVLTTTATQVATGGITSGSDIISDTDSTDSLGSTAVRWLKGWFDTLTAGTLTIGSGSVTDSSGAISFGNENLSTTGTLASGNLDVTGTLDVSGTTTGTGGFNVPNNVPVRGTTTGGGTARMLRMSSSNVIEVGATSQAMDIFASTATVSNHLDVTGGLRVSGEQATPLTNEGLYSGHASRGAYIQGHGSANDFTVANQAGTIAIAVPQSTINVEARGNLDVTGLFGLGARQSVTIASGAITATSSIIRIDTQGAASTDNLDTINGSAAGRIIIVHTTSSARDVVLKNGTGNLALAGGDVTLGSSTQRLMLMSDGSSWIQVAPKSA